MNRIQSENHKAGTYKIKFLSYWDDKSHAFINESTALVVDASNYF